METHLTQFNYIFHLPAARSLVRMYLSFRLSESKSVPFRFCSVILAEEPEKIQRNQCFYLTLITLYSDSQSHVLLLYFLSILLFRFCCCESKYNTVFTPNRLLCI
uniref:Uncharacterized protein n=1 Tax=Mastacembelus armatus TaxID=205130 RepID=A0A3Q3MCQ2_9TELE